MLTKPVRQSVLLDTLMTVLLPEAVAELAAKPATQQPATDQTSRVALRVLVAEDNIVNQRVAMGMLARLGCRTDFAANGREAVEMARAVPYDLIFMDCQMPEMDGFEATVEIRRLGIPVRIVAMTANALEGDRDQCLAVGMDDYLSKPVEQEALRRVLGINRPARKEASTTGQQPFDFQRLNEISAGEHSVIQDLMALYLLDATSSMKMLRDMLATGERGSIKSVAHSLKGGAGNMGAKVMYGLAADLEAGAIQGDLSKLTDLVERMGREMERIKKAGEAVLSSGGANAPPEV